MLLENGLTTTQFCTKLEILIYAKKKKEINYLASLYNPVFVT